MDASEFFDKIRPDLVGWLQVALALIAIVISVLLFRRERRLSALAWSTLEVRPLLGTSRFPLRVHHGDQWIQEPTLTVMRFANSGNQSITVDAFSGSLAVRFSATELLSFRLTASRPIGLPLEMSVVDDDTILIKPLLLNPGDMFEIQCLTNGRPGVIEPSARIAGVSAIDEVKLPRDSWGRTWRYSRFDRVNFLVMPLLVVALSLTLISQDSVTPRLFGTALVCAAVIIWPICMQKSVRRNSLFLGE